MRCICHKVISTEWACEQSCRLDIRRNGLKKRGEVHGMGNRLRIRDAASSGEKYHSLASGKGMRREQELSPISTHSESKEHESGIAADGDIVGSL